MSNVQRSSRPPSTPAVRPTGTEPCAEAQAWVDELDSIFSRVPADLVDEVFGAFCTIWQQRTRGHSGTDGEESNPSDDDEESPSSGSSALRIPQNTSGGRASPPLAADQAVVLPLPIQFSFDIDQACSRSNIEHIYKQAFAGLNGLRISYIKSNQEHSATLTPIEAQKILDVVFNQMLGTIMDRLRQIYDGVEAYNAVQTANVAGSGAAAPEAIRRLFTSLSNISRGGQPKALRCLIYNIEIVKLHQAWEEIRASLGRKDASSRQYIEYLQLGDSGPGASDITRAINALCERVGITSKRFYDHIRNAHVPAALHVVEHFGPGAVLFCPSNMSGYKSAALEYFASIKAADDGSIQRTADALYHCIVRPVWEGELLQLARGITINADGPLIPTLAMLRLDSSPQGEL